MRTCYRLMTKPSCKLCMGDYERKGTAEASANFEEVP